MMWTKKENDKTRVLKRFLPFALTVLVVPAIAADGDLDLTFGIGGESSQTFRVLSMPRMPWPFNPMERSLQRVEHRSIRIATSDSRATTGMVRLTRRSASEAKSPQTFRAAVMGRVP